MKQIISRKQKEKIMVSFIIVVLLTIVCVVLAVSISGKRKIRDEIDVSEVVSTPAPPVITTIENAYLYKVTEDAIYVFYQNELYQYNSDYIDAGAITDCICDITFTDQVLTQITIKNKTLKGTVLRANNEFIEFAEYGKYYLTDTYQGYYRDSEHPENIIIPDDMDEYLYPITEKGDTIHQDAYVRDIQSVSYKNLYIGYDFYTFILDGDKICSFIYDEELSMDEIRVLIRSTGFESKLHSEIQLELPSGTNISKYSNGVAADTYVDTETKVDISECFDQMYDRIIFTPPLDAKITILSVERSQGNPQYSGRIEIFHTEEGYCIINQLPLEEYLLTVVPSEMPSKYPAEALAAQAVCARTYAYIHMQKAGYFNYGAHLDDSTAYQVYNNLNEQTNTTEAVHQTKGQILLTEDGKVAETYFYSTSCGIGTDANIWKTKTAATLTYLVPQRLTSNSSEEDVYLIGQELQEEAAFRTFIDTKDSGDFEYNESYYRWSYTVSEIDTDRMLELLQNRQQANEERVLVLENGEYVIKEIDALGQIYDLIISKRGLGGVSDELIIDAEYACVKVITEHNIRYVLDDGITKLVLNNGKTANANVLLPSGFFYVNTRKDGDVVVGYTLNGGGYGHGVGMSQIAAREMAKQGMNYTDILSYFYKNCHL